MYRATRLSSSLWPPNHSKLGALGVVLLVTVGLATPASAAEFFVIDTIDAIPAPPGSLRAAIEASELNGEPDTITFLIDGGTIELVAPLPDLREGRLVIGTPRAAATPSAANGIAISGANGVSRAIRVRSADNAIGELDFIAFGGNEVILITGGGSDRNLISGCVFGRNTAPAVNAGAAIRIEPDSLTLGTPSGTVIRLSRFVRNGAGIVIEGDGVVDPQSPRTWIEANWFGTDDLGGPGPGTGDAIRSTHAGSIVISGNRFSGPGTGIYLGAGSNGSSVRSNRIGLPGSDSTTCSGFDIAGVRVEQSTGIVIEDNEVSCSEVGVLLGSGARGTELRENVIGGPGPLGHRTHGVFIESVGEDLIRRNRISGNAGFGIAASPDSAIEPLGSLIACNSIWDNAAGGLDLPSVVQLPPHLTSATPLHVQGDLQNPIAGWVEVFGDDAGQARVFQGAVSIGNDEPPFVHRLPVLGLRLAQGSVGVELDFDREIPSNHSATLSVEPSHETTELSNSIPADPVGVVFDVIRGRLENLAFSGTGGIDLGPVVCLGSGIPPGGGPPGISDPTTPAVGSAFFYVVRRRDELANLPGTYDPAICLADVDRFGGPRTPSSGDCP